MGANPNPVSPKTHPARNAATSATNGEVLSTAMDHAEEGVWPVLVGGPLVAVRDRLVLSKNVADFLYALLGHLPDTHCIRAKARLAVVENSREAAHDPALLQVVCPLQEFLRREPYLPAPEVKRR